jgi:NAD(P)-dependent dehydrogenase (short-subunit alcohol dehydrogenase family)
MSLPYKTIWITGAGSGIGREAALQLADQGATVIASARSADNLETLVKDAKPLAGRVVAKPFDVTQLDVVRETVRAVADDLGLPDLAILNAGTYRPEKTHSLSADTVGAQVATNLMGGVNMIDALLPRFLARGRGHIAVVSSVAGYRGLPSAAGYGATKAALINLCEALRADLVGTGIKVQLVNPGFVKTPLTDKNTFKMPFLMPVETAVRRMIAGLATDRFEITFPKRFTWQMKLMRVLPYALYFPLVRAITRRGR